MRIDLGKGANVAKLDKKKVNCPVTLLHFLKKGRRCFLKNSDQETLKDTKMKK